MDHLTPKQIVAELDKYIIGQQFRSTAHLWPFTLIPVATTTKNTYQSAIKVGPDSMQCTLQCVGRMCVIDNHHRLTRLPTQTHHSTRYRMH